MIQFKKDTYRGKIYWREEFDDFMASDDDCRSFECDTNLQASTKCNSCRNAIKRYGYSGKIKPRLYGRTIYMQKVG